MAEGNIPAAEGFLWLDVNTHGSWKHVLRFAGFNAPQVRERALWLALLGSSNVAFRLADEDQKAVAYCSWNARDQTYEWRPA